MAGWEVGAGAGRFWRTSSGGGTGKTTGEALDGSLLTSKTSIGPEELLRRIWHFLCPLMGCIWTQTKTELTRSQSVHFNCLSLLCRTYIFWPGHLQLCADGSANCQECFICKKKQKDTRLIVRQTKCNSQGTNNKLQIVWKNTFERSTQVIVFDICHSRSCVKAHRVFTFGTQ